DGLWGSIAVRSKCVRRDCHRRLRRAGSEFLSPLKRCGTMTVVGLLRGCPSKVYTNVEHRTSNVERRLGKVFSLRCSMFDVQSSVSFLLAGLIFVGLLAAANLAHADYAEAMALFRAGKYAECIEEAAEGIAEEASSENLRSLKIRAELALGRYAEALESL